MSEAFWDSSSIVPLFLNQPASSMASQYAREYGMTVWWSTPVEIKSAFARLLRMGHTTLREFTGAHTDLAQLRQSWREILPRDAVRENAETFVDRFQLRAADAQQLAAAFAWTLGNPAGRVFISGDAQLLIAAKQLGFETLQT